MDKLNGLCQQKWRYKSYCLEDLEDMDRTITMFLIVYQEIWRLFIFMHYRAISGIKLLHADYDNMDLN